MVINEKDVVKNVDAATVPGRRAGATATPPRGHGSKAGALFALVLAGATALVTLAPTRSEAKQPSGLDADVTLGSLSPEARRTDQLIHSGGPFPFSRDGVVFGNYEKRLPREPRGWYHEYTDARRANAGRPSNHLRRQPADGTRCLFLYRRSLQQFSSDREVIVGRRMSK